MGKIIVACQTLRDELRMALKETGVDYPVIYIEAGLHKRPDALHQKIQEELNSMENVDMILMVFGYCGNSLLGITSQHAKLVIPKVDDCISLLLGSCEARKNISNEMGTFFLTKGWLDYETSLLWEYERCVERYGQSRALRVMKFMLGHYKRFMLIDTGAYKIEEVLPSTQRFAETLTMQHEIVSGSLRLLHKLLQGPWDKEFFVLEPGQEITKDDICGGDLSGESQLLVGQDR